jgi:hypothetical protein
VNVMLSYRSSDVRFMDEVATFLRARGVDPWIDREGIAEGARWREALLEELRVCDKFIAILSDEYLNSEHCRMEVFVARSFGRPILPVMLNDAFTRLRSYEETKGLEDVFMMRIYKLNAVGLPISREEAFERILRSTLGSEAPGATLIDTTYISYATHDGQFATELAAALNDVGVRTWIATHGIAVGENWRDAQARAMMRSSTHVVVLDEGIVRQNVLRTEILLSEARGLPTFAVLPPRLNGRQDLVSTMLRDLDSSDQTYRRLAATQYFSCLYGLAQTASQLGASLRPHQRT